MFITDVRIDTADTRTTARFYRDVLDLPVSVSDDAAVVTVGRSTVTFVRLAGVTESNHLAFTIPSNRFAEAKAWLAERVDPMSWDGGETELRLGEPWNSESVYFLGPDDIILELITRAHLANPSDEPFSGAQLLCVSEVGLATSNVAKAFADVRRNFGVQTFAGESPDFTTVGDQEGLLILVTEGRPWFPRTDMRAATGSVRVTLGGVSAGVVKSDSGWTVTGRSGIAGTVPA
jgi:catechol 2,3-dioxygenase-like lactoylglutathione lyase family enzyme